MVSEAEKLIDAYGDAQRSLGAHRESQFLSASDLMADSNETATMLFLVKQTRDALIALLARDDARTRRLEKVCEAARYMLAVGPYAKARDQLTVALSALDDADAPGGG